MGGIIQMRVITVMMGMVVITPQDVTINDHMGMAAFINNAAFFSF